MSKFGVQLLSVAFVLGVCYVNVCNSDHCEHLLSQLADHQGHFVYCSTMHSANVTICTLCSQQYNQTVQSYELLVNNKNCSDKFFDKDRINIVDTIEKTLTGLWDKAYCQNCWTNDNWLKFDDIEGKFKQCVDDYKDDVCASCLLNYKQLNEFYTELEKSEHGKVCYDLQDTMNRTRYNWSHTYKCCKRHFDDQLFLIASSLITSIPVLFYASLYAYNRYRERNPGLLEVENPRSTRTHVNVSAAPIANVEASTSGLVAASETPDDDNANVAKKDKHFTDCSDSDDEAMA